MPYKTNLTYWGKEIVSLKQTKIEIKVGESEFNKKIREEKEKREYEKEIKWRAELLARDSAYSRSKGSEVVEVVGKSSLQCIQYYKEQTGKTQSLGYAGNIKPQGYEAVVGAGALEREHISLVVEVGDNWIKVRESNYRAGFITQRVINKNQVRGYIY